jgi:serine/threonine protein kinase
MNLEAELKLSYYKEIADVDDVHKVKLVQHAESGKVFVLKTLSIYDIRVFQYLAANPAQGTPRIVELIEDGSLLYVVEEYISGTSLRDKLNASETFCEAKAVALIRQLCDILRPLHKLNPPIVHRDIKPSNIIITLDSKMVLVDFNSAKESGNTKSQDTVLIGTVGYAAPEQYGFSASRPTADIYAIGVLLNELLTGNLPNEEVYGGNLEPVIRKCLQMDPINRYQSVDELLRAINIAVKPRITFWADVRSWLPPGLRNRNPWIALSSMLWYIFITAISFSLEVKNAAGGELQMNRIFCFLILLSETLWLGNYRNIWSYLPLSKSRNVFLKILGIIIWSIALIFALFLVLAIVSSVAYH